MVQNATKDTKVPKRVMKMVLLHRNKYNIFSLTMQRKQTLSAHAPHAPMEQMTIMEPPVPIRI